MQASCFPRWPRRKRTTATGCKNPTNAPSLSHSFLEIFVVGARPKQEVASRKTFRARYSSEFYVPIKTRWLLWTQFFPRLLLKQFYDILSAFYCSCAETFINIPRFWVNLENFVSILPGLTAMEMLKFMFFKEMKPNCCYFVIHCVFVISEICQAINTILKFTTFRIKAL